ncbi:hypothetical protein D3C76_1507850 [compost metagenome]
MSRSARYFLISSPRFCSLVSDDLVSASTRSIAACEADSAFCLSDAALAVASMVVFCFCSAATCCSRNLVESLLGPISEKNDASPPPFFRSAMIFW